MEHETSAWAAGDRRFHEALYGPSGRVRTLQLIAILRNAAERFYIANLSHDAHRRGWRSEHRELLKAVSLGNTAAACELLRAHLKETHQVIIKVMLRGK